MSEKPILFSTHMVKAILAGKKTQTRRIAKITDPFDYPQFNAKVVNLNGKTYWWDCQKDHPDHIVNHCPHGKIGDKLWVRESWSTSHQYDTFKPSLISQNAPIYYHADGENISGLIKRPSIFMPKHFSRITLEITAIRVERLQDISEVDAIAEGVSNDMGITFMSGDDTPIGMYGELWQSINGTGSWDANPWVWVIEFKRV